jgi:hypothetical protein
VVTYMRCCLHEAKEGEIRQVPLALGWNSWMTKRGAVSLGREKTVG